MKALVFSDSHGSKSMAIEMMDKERDAEYIFFLGDGYAEAEYLKRLYPEKKFILVKGNNDYSCNADTEAYKHIDGVTVMACHGHLLDVRYTLTSLLDKAHSVRAHIALYGHTHKNGMYNDPVTGVCAINPGALCTGNYCVLTIKNGQFDVVFKRI